MTFAEIGISLSGSSSQQKVKHCPNCEKLGKRSNDNSLSVNVEKGVYKCHKCGWSGRINNDLKKEYQKPNLNTTDLSLEFLQFFTSRGITQEAVKQNNISQVRNSFIFPYYVNGEMINYKARDKDNKNKMFQQKEGKQVVYNYDFCKGEKEIIIVEGELDVLAFNTAGIWNVTSVSQGAPNEGDKTVDKKLECITNCYELFEQAETVIIAVDKDANGKRLELELIRRIGAEKCKVAEFNQKDANDVLIHDGAEALRQSVLDAKMVKVEGIFQLDDVWENMLHTFRNGKNRGTTTYFKRIDACWTWRTGEVNIWTGYNNEGKTQFLHQLCLLKAINEGKKFAIFSPENFPADDFYDDLIHSYVGKSTDLHYKNVMTENEYRDAAEFISKYFFLIYPEDSFSLESIEEKVKYLVKREGIYAAVLDPYNQIDHIMRSGEREDLYISRFMSMLKKSAVKMDISYHLVAHQTTPKKGEDGNYPKPNLYSIKGGGTFSDKADNVLIIHRPRRATDNSDSTVDFYSDKIKKQRLVGIPGYVPLQFDRASNRYFDNNDCPIENSRWNLRQENNLIIAPKNEEVPF